MRNSILSVVFILNALIVKAQNPAMLTTFEVNKYQNSILIDWEIAGGNLCSGLKVEHSTDSINFITVYDYPGVCGNSITSERYSFIHNNPVSNVRNYYRINLNSNGNSDIIGITFIKLEETGYALFPMPLESKSKLYYSNDNNAAVNFTVFNSSGIIVLTKEAIKENEIDLGHFTFPIGLYYFKIAVGENSPIEGKFIVAK